MSFTNVFGGSTLQSADVAYRAVSLTANVSLVWPPLSTSATDFVARIMDVTPSAGSKTITMPPANQVSQGFDVIYANPSAFTYTVLDNAGNTLAAITANQYVYLYLTDNSTTAGVWKSFVYGVGTGASNAATLAGYGLTAISTTLNAMHTITTKAVNYTIATTDRASLLVWTAGAGTFTLPLAANALQGFFVEIRNAGTGSLTIAAGGSDTTDGSATVVLQPSESLIQHSDGVSAWYSVGRGRATQFNFSQLTKAVTGGTATLSTTESANVVQIYTGILATNQIIVEPGIVQVYYVQNQTNGAYSLTFQTPTPGSTVTVPTGQNAILVSDGTNIVNASNTLSGLSSFTINTATAAAPSLNFSGNTNTGLYQPASNTIGFTVNGAEVGRMNVNGFAGKDGTASLPSYAFTASTSTGMYSPAANQLALTQNGVQALLISGSQQVTIGNVNITGGAITGVGGFAIPRSPRTSNTILASADKGTFVDITSGTFTQTFTAAATLGSGWYVYLRNSGTGVITIPSSDGFTNWPMYPGECRLFTCDASAFYGLVIQPFYYSTQTSFTFGKVPGYSSYGIDETGGGGGGGGGEGRAAGNIRLGGSGGGGGGRNRFSIAASLLGSTVSVTVGAAGTAGTGGSGAGGNAGTAGGNTSFGIYGTAYGGGAGFGSTGTAVSGGGGGGSITAGVNGSTSSATVGSAPRITTGASGAAGTGGAPDNTCAEFGGGGGATNAIAGNNPGTGGSSMAGGCGGGGGGPIDASNAATNASAGGVKLAYTTGGGGAGGTGATGIAGTAGVATGAGGGGGGANTSGTGGAGGAGGGAGDGGGGGGGGTSIGGAGGAGQLGQFIIWGIA